MKIACFVELYNFKGKAERGAIFNFKSAAEAMGHSFDFIYKEDIPKICNYDALFIRATTDPSNIAYIASRTAEQYGLKVIDDPRSIRICSNKVILHDLFLKNNIPSPKSILFTGDYSKESLDSIFATLGLPVVIKSPYSRFSSHVERAYTEQEFIRITKSYIRKSSVLVLQEYVKSEFDWRVGILQNKVLYLCKYFIPSGGWKVKSRIDGKLTWGNTIAISRSEIPPELEKISIDLSKCIGEGFYGLDVKETENEYKVIEINDNPSIYKNYEDSVDKDIYEKLINALVS